ncbi:collagen alpha-1(XXI) chain-like [Haliotis cracherodii]|uniref:collagen alpha-1(XXI) chain-like n=1 Tax=Haliotis cracherodii TaxID=6455 RepID=UPI0039ECCC3F
MEHILALVVCVCMMSTISAKALDYDDFLMQSDPHGWFGNFAVDEQSGIVPRGCGGKPADVYFVMDTSRDVTQKEIDLQKNYFKELSSLFYLGMNTVRLGVISSGNTPLTAIRLGSYKNTDDFKKAIDITPRVGGQRDHAQTLDFLRRTAFAPTVARQSVAHVVIFMTNGFSHNAKATLVEARLLKKAGVYVFTVNLGGRWDRSELTAMASPPASDFVFDSDDYNIIDPLIRLLKIHECDYQIHPPVAEPKAACSPKRKVDMVFAVDHMHIGAVKSKRILAFIDSLFSDFDHGDNLNTALLLSRPASTGVLSNRLTEVTETEDEMDRVAFPDFSAVLRRTRRALTKGRQSVQKTAVVFVDSNVPLTHAAFKEAKRNKFKKIDTYVVYIGDDYNKNDLELISNGKENIIIVPSYDELEISKEDVLTSLCKGL